MAGSKASVFLALQQLGLEQKKCAFLEIAQSYLEQVIDGPFDSPNKYHHVPLAYVAIIHPAGFPRFVRSPRWIRFPEQFSSVTSQYE